MEPRTLVLIPVLAAGGLLQAQVPLPSLQGFSGLLNTPHAWVTQEGEVSFLYTNQIESFWQQRARWQESWILNVGAFPYVEGGFRLTEARPKGVPGSTYFARDLSSNAKLQLPGLPDWAPKVAIGFQDFGGMAPHFRTKYGVLSQTVGPLRLSLGYGTGPQRMKGVFGGAEWVVAPWLNVVAEHDTVQRNAGVKLMTPQGWLPLASVLGGVAKVSTGGTGRSHDLSFFLRVPLSGRTYRTPERTPTPPPPAVLASPAPAAPSPLQAASQRIIPSHNLADHLVRMGFQNVRVGSSGQALVVVLENNRFNHNDLDGLGLALGTATAAAPQGTQEVRLFLTKQGIRVLEVSAPLEKLRAFFATPSLTGSHCEQLASQLEVRREASLAAPSQTQWQGEARNGSAYTARLLLYPGLLQHLMSDVGLYDYQLSLKPDLLVSLWKGAILNARWDIPVSWNKNYREGEFWGNTRGQASRLERVFFSQTLPLAPGLLVQVGGGQYDYRNRGFLGQAQWNPGDGQHRLALTGGQIRIQDGPLRKTVLGSYRYYWPSLDTSIEATAGSFYGRDEGYKIEVKRHFRDSTLSLYYAKTLEKVVGFNLGIPLTPRRDMRPGLIQVRGTERFLWGRDQTIRTKSGVTEIIPGMLEIPETMASLDRAYTNQDRLGKAYILQHLDRLHEAYWRWKDR